MESYVFKGKKEGTSLGIQERRKKTRGVFREKERERGLRGFDLLSSFRYKLPVWYASIEN